MLQQALSAAVLTLLLSATSHALVINEISASNDSILYDFENDSPDWIELYNESSSAVDLTNYTLTDDATKPEKWTFPDAVIKAHQFLIIFCSGKDTLAADELHASFKLSADGEHIGLYNALGEPVDSLTFPALQTDQSFGRVPDGGSFVFMLNPTPGGRNSRLAGTLTAAPANISHASGCYDNVIHIALSSDIDNTSIRYTLDGAEPTQKSALYRAPLSINSTTVLRTRVFHPDINPGPISTRLYYINENSDFFKLPVLALVTDPKNLWDDNTGIYANATESGDEWERPVTIIYMEKNAAPGFNVAAGIRIHGGASRKKSQKKSFRLYFRSEYGPARLTYPIIPSTENDEFDRIILRAGYNDSWTHKLDKERRAATYHRDQLVRDLFLQIGYPAVHGDYLHLFLNDEYWGLYNICERYDDDFFDHYVEKAGWDVVKPGADEDRNAIEAADGDMDVWNEFENWYKKASLKSSRDYEEFKRRVDIDNFIDFYILNIWAQNTDWPRHNWYAFRARDDLAKWRFLPWDAEYAFGGGAAAFKEDVNMFNTIQNQAEKYAFSDLLARLKENDDFARAVVLRYRSLAQSVLQPDRFKAMMHARSTQIERAIPFESDRWGHLFAPDYICDATTWQQALDAMESFAENRDHYVQQHLNSNLANSVETPAEGPVAFQLFGNYPNPFNPKTMIRYALPRDGLVRLEIFDINGRRVHRLSDGIQQAGIHEIEWDSAGAASGVYLLRMQAEGFSATRQMLLLR